MSKDDTKLKEVHQYEDITFFYRNYSKQWSLWNLEERALSGNSREQDTLMKEFHIFEGKIKVLQKELKELNELQDHLTWERYDLW